ncbi:hypothetical protein ACKWTF_013528 [Chironomus riparius]
MSLKIIILTLMLSIVVPVTDSCTSITGWKLRHVDVDHKEPIATREMTTKTIDIDNDNNIKNLSRMQRFYTEPIILQIGEEPERCEDEFEKVYCHNHGKCIKIKIPGSSSYEKAHCICDDGYSDSRCMTKVPDGEYRTIKDRSDINHKHPSSTTIVTTTETKTLSSTERNIANEPNKKLGDKSPCPEPWNHDFCINGECIMLPHLSTVDYFCDCHNEFTGLRCERKAIDYHDLKIRARRDIRGRFWAHT